jgi:predicted small metal-binding protein
MDKNIGTKKFIFKDVLLYYMAKEEYKQLSCSDVGMACGFQVRAKTVDEVMKHAKTHAAEAHGLKEISANTEKKIKDSIKTVSVDVPEKK